MAPLRKKQVMSHIGPKIVLSFDVFHDELEMDVTEAEACTDGNSCSLASARLEKYIIQAKSGCTLQYYLTSFVQLRLPRSG
jgi:hypothetical protein